MHPEIAEVIAGTRPWTVIHADCLDVLKTLPDGCVDAVVTDPPYGMGFKSNYRNISHRAIANDGDDSMLAWACGLAVNHSRYVFCRWDNVGAIHPRSLITWVKNNWSMGDLEHEHARQTEAIAFWPGPNHHWPTARPTDIVHHARTGNALHPTEKPVSLMIEVVSWVPHDAIVLDPFCGSGTTGVACIQTGRRFIGIEIDEKYASIARRRIADAAPLFVPQPSTPDPALFSESP